MPRRQTSLRRRLLLAFGLLLALFLGLTGLVLDRAFQDSVSAALEQRLRLQINALLGVAEPDPGGLVLAGPADARFAQIDSGLYGFVHDDAGRELWRSPSALNLELRGDVLSAGEPGEFHFGEFDSPRQGRLSWAGYATWWESRDREYRFTVLESQASARAEIRAFQSRLWSWLGAVLVLLAALQYALLRWGLAPLARLAAEITDIEAGRRERLAGDYPAELQALSENLNLLIVSERARQERYRATLGDLAHSLKTPLAVVAGIVEQRARQGADADLREIGEQVERMNQIVSWQLKRAVQRRHALLARPVPLRAVLDKVVAALDKVYRDKGVGTSLAVDGDAAFPGEESDFMEVAGNLLDNAYKFCRREVRVRAGEQGGELWLEVHDDGPGIPAAQHGWVLERGARGDSAASGQGLGLALVADIASAYGGTLDIRQSPLGGACLRFCVAK